MNFEQRVIQQGRLVQYVASIEDEPVSFERMMQAFASQEPLLDHFMASLEQAPFSAYRWETPPIRLENKDRPFEFVLIDAPYLERPADRVSFGRHFSESEGGVAVFDNLGGDARLIVPVPDSAGESFPHLGAFMQAATVERKRIFWAEVGASMLERLGHRPIWLNTAGDGVAWLHVRLDSRPKYYHFTPYKHRPTQSR